MSTQDLSYSFYCLVYLLMMILTGIIFSKGEMMTPVISISEEEACHLYVTAMSAEASDMSSWLLMGIPGLAYISGIADPFWTCLGLAVGTYLNWLLVSKRLRSYTEKIGAITVAGVFFEKIRR